MKFICSIAQNFALIFSGRNILWHLTAIGLTFILVVLGFDWFYYSHTQTPTIWAVLFPAVILGTFVPVLLPIGLLAAGYLQKKKNLIHSGWILVETQIIAELLSFFYKALTGRVSPHFVDGNIDISHMFRFGFFRGGIFWGWPSSHTTLAFTTAFTMIVLFPKSKAVLTLMLAYAFYVGIGVSATIHWFSEFAAGGIFGAMVGIVVTKNLLLPDRKLNRVVTNL